MEFEFRQEGGEVSQCDSCNFPAPTSEFNAHNGAKRLLCAFCSSTMASRHTEYPQQEEFGQLRAEIWKAAAGVFNMLRYGDDAARASPAKEQCDDV